MASFIKSLFGGKKDKSPARHLTHPRELACGDIVKFKLFTPAPLANENYTIAEVNTYDYKSGNETELVLRGAGNQTVFMSVDESDDEVELRLSIKLPRNVVEQLFDLEQFSVIFDDQQAQLNLKKDLNLESDWSWLTDWTAPKYLQNSHSVCGYYHKGDYRNKILPDSADNCDELDYYSLISDDENYYIEIEVFDGDTDVMVTRLFSEDDIEEMWPAT